mmetsp:Transcript_64716/g.75964  ORF Transcript_64716/g.75964 Transcript_64716/m.75964 type:complete len:82 (-) Transcript_64716:1923-2168(-)
MSTSQKVSIGDGLPLFADIGDEHVMTKSAIVGMVMFYRHIVIEENALKAYFASSVSSKESVLWSHINLSCEGWSIKTVAYL